MNGYMTSDSGSLCGGLKARATQETDKGHTVRCGPFSMPSQRHVEAP